MDATMTTANEMTLEQWDDVWEWADRCGLGPTADVSDLAERAYGGDRESLIQILSLMREDGALTEKIS
jgi:hypothetical protein